MHEVVEVREVRGLRSSVPVSDGQLTEQAISRLPAPSELGGELAALHHPRQEQLQRRHVLWQGRRALATHTHSTVGSDLKIFLKAL